MMQASIGLESLHETVVPGIQKCQFEQKLLQHTVKIIRDLLQKRSRKNEQLTIWK